MSSEARRAALLRAVEEGYRAQVRWELPDLEADSDTDEVRAFLYRHRALTLIEQELVAPDALRRRRQPFGEEWATEWWRDSILPAARRHSRASWWLNRAPRRALSWAIALDPAGASRKGFI